MGSVRLKFIFNQQKKLIEEVYAKSKLSTETLAKIANIHPRSFRDWRREKLTMTLAAAEKFIALYNVVLPEDKEVLVERWQNAKKRTSRIGGLALFRKRGSPATLEGRRRGGIKAIANLRKNGIIPSVKIYNLPTGFSKELAEYVGIILGDGGLTAGQCAITLNSEADHEYASFVSRLGKNLFGESPKYYKRKDSKALVLYYNGSILIRYLLSIGLKVGNKVRQQVGVPGWIKQIKNYRIACLRGLMDTDGGVFNHRYKVNGKVYMYRKICFSNRSVPILMFVRDILKDIGFTPKVIDKVENKKVWLYNEKEVEEYLKVVSSHNQRLLKYQQ